MRLEKWASIAEIVGAVAVTLSLLFVGLQIGENTRATQAATLQESVGYDIQLLLTLAADPDTANRITAFLPLGYAGVPEENRMQIEYLFSALVRHWENLYLQYRGGMLSEEAWLARKVIIENVVGSPGFSEYLTSPAGSNIAGEFLEYAREVMQQRESATPSQDLEAR